MPSLTVVHAKRENLFSQIQSIYDLSRKTSDPNILQQLLIKARSVDRLRQEFSDALDLCNELELEADEKYVPNYASLNSVNELVDNIHATVSVIEAKRQSKLKLETSQPLVVPQLNVRLPKLELRHFSGDSSQWMSFISLYDSSIHNNATLSPVIKFQYLLSILQDEPLKLIKSLPITEANYKIAYDLLKARYHSLRRLVTLHLTKIIDLPSINYNPTPMRAFVDAYVENMQTLKALGTDISGVNPLLSTLILRKLDVDLRKRFEHVHTSADDDDVSGIPKAKDIIDFLDQECTEAEAASFNTESKLTTPKEAYRPSAFKGTHSTSKRVSLVSATVERVNQPQTSGVNLQPCFSCTSSEHKIYACPGFKNKTPTERFSLVKALNRCVSCLGNHDLKACKSQSCCHTCKKRHHTLLHFTVTQPTNSKTGNAPDLTPHKPNRDLAPTSSNVLSSSVATSFQGSHPHQQGGNYTVLLGTALIKLTGLEGHTHVFRALLDSGSMCNLITERAAQTLNSRRHKSTVNLCGLSQNVTENKGQIFANLETLSGEILAPLQPFVVLEKITVDLPRAHISSQVIKRAHRYLLADPTFHVPSAIDIVIGGAHFAQLMVGSTHNLGKNMPQALGTRLGFVIIGSAPCAFPLSLAASQAITTVLATTDAELHSSLQRFWQLEEPPTFIQKNEDEEKCDSHFKNTYSRDPNGRYMVKLPFKEDQPSLGTSRPVAERRFHALERKFSTSSELKSSYVQSIRDHIAQGHLVKASTSDLNSPHYFLPHHGVIKEGSSTTKLRIVFDASCKTSSGQSLNDTLLTGPKLQTDIVDILLHFRTHKIVFTCDIRQMYLQILVHPAHQPFQLVLWRNNGSEELDTYKLTRVTFGVNSSPYLACRTLRQLANDEGHAFPEASHVLKTQTYIDDVICGASSVEEAQTLQSQLIQLLKKGGFELRKWVSNAQELLQNIPQGHKECPGFLANSAEPHFSILGMHWSPQTDCFIYQVTTVQALPTKRNVLSFVAKLYDPCGFVAPTVMLAKCFIQLLWTSGLSWDEPLPADLAEKWQNFVQDTQCLSNLSIPRSFEFSPSHDLECHGFCDASEMGFSAIVYFKCQLPNGQVIIRPVVAKTRVAPLKRVTIPRLELCAAHLLAKLIAHCSTLLRDKVKPNNVYLWSDSTVVLTWIRTPPYRLKTYVANRVAQIQELARPEVWRHVSTKDNPADCASRGITASQLVGHGLWWTGPSWLRLPDSEWPASDFTSGDLTSSGELKQTPLTVLVTTQQEEWSLLTRYSSWDRLQRITAWILRFVGNLRSKHRRTGHLSVQDLNTAKQKIFALVQRSAFNEDFSRLQKDEGCSTRLQRLKPYIHTDGLLRVGGRLNLTRLSPDVRNPVLLPKSHKVVDLLIDYCHTSHLHSGPQLTQALLSQSVWILSARSVIRSRIFKCIKCFRTKPINKTPLMGDLPLPRVTPARAFLSTGIDYTGPFSSKILNLKSIRLIKVYLCIFVCMVTKAVHIEVVQDLTTDSFIAALTRFVARRGLCTDIYSDCGTNFVGANAALRQIIRTLHQSDAKEKLQRFSTSQGMKFHFNPPAAPHQGGLWESAVKSAKHHLRRTMGDSILTLPELVTLSTQVEAMLNSRPLTLLSHDPSDLSALTPGHFLIGAPLASLPEPDLLLTPQNRLKQWQLVQSLNQRIWRRWHLEYLHTLHQRVKWIHSSPNLKVGDLVLVHAPSAPLAWPLARIIEAHPGADGIVRVVDVKTASGTLTRPATKVFPLPID